MIPITTTWKHAKVHALTMCPDAILSIFLRECTLLKWCFQWKYLVCVVLISCANFPLCVWTCWYLVLIQFTQYIYVYIEKISEYAYTWQSGCCGRSCESHDNADLIWICRKENPQKKKFGKCQFEFCTPDYVVGGTKHYDSYMYSGQKVKSTTPPATATTTTGANHHIGCHLEACYRPLTDSLAPSPHTLPSLQFCGLCGAVVQNNWVVNRWTTGETIHRCKMIT